MDTAGFIQHVTDKMRENPPRLKEDWEIIDGIAFAKKEVELYTDVHYGKKVYPRKKQAKEKCLAKH